MTAYCTATDLESYVLPTYMTAAEKLRPGCRDRHIAQVSAEIDEVLAPLYQVPLSPVPATVQRICAVLAAYRVIGEATTLMNEDGTTKNEWVPLQTLRKQCQSELSAMREGKPGYGLDGYELVDQAVVVVTDRPRFGDAFWRRY